MKIKDYDIAMLARFTEVFSRTYFVQNVKDALQSIRDRDSELVFPNAVLTRVGTPVIIPSNESFLRRGKYEEVEIDDVKLRKLYKRGMFELVYQLDIRSKSKENYDDLMVEMQMNILECPMIVVDLENLGKIEVTLILNEVVDNSDIESYKDNIQVYRGTLTLIVQVPIYKSKDADYIETVVVEVEEGI